MQEVAQVEISTSAKITTLIEAADELRRLRPPQLTDAVIVTGSVAFDEQRSVTQFRFRAWRHSREMDFVLTVPGG